MPFLFSSVLLYFFVVWQVCGREKVCRKVLRFLSQVITSDERFPKPHLITQTQALEAVALLSISLARALEGRTMLGREAEHYQVFICQGCGEPRSLREIQIL